MVRGETDENTSDCQTRSCMARNLDENWENRSEPRKQEWAKEKPKLDSARKPREFILLIQMSAQEDGSGVAIDWVAGRSCSSGVKAGRRLNVQSGLRKGDNGPAWPENWSERGRP